MCKLMAMAVAKGVAMGFICFNNSIVPAKPKQLILTHGLFGKHLHTCNSKLGAMAVAKGVAMGFICFNAPHCDRAYLRKHSWQATHPMIPVKNECCFFVGG